MLDDRSHQVVPDLLILRDRLVAAPAVSPTARKQQAVMRDRRLQITALLVSQPQICKFVATSTTLWYHVVHCGRTRHTAPVHRQTAEIADTSVALADAPLLRRGDAANTRDFGEWLHEFGIGGSLRGHAAWRNRRAKCCS
jgi:hypothetical protein